MQPLAIIWRNSRLRVICYQILLLTAIILGCWYAANNALTNLSQQGIASGFGFLRQQTGFSIIMHLIDYSERSTYLRAFVVGLLNTLLVSAIGIVYASILGLVIGIARLSRNWLIAKLALIYIEIFRNIPLLLQIFFWYFAILRHLPRPQQSHIFFDSVVLNIRGLYLPKLIITTEYNILFIAIILAAGLSIAWYWYCGYLQQSSGKQLSRWLPILITMFSLPALTLVIADLPLQFEYPQLGRFNFQGGIIIIPEFIAMLLALSIYTAAFIAEIVRAGILAVPPGQTEAAYALGLKPNLTMRLIIIPQALRIIIPPLTSQYLNLIKNSSLAAAIAYPDLVAVFAGTVLNQTGQAIEVIAITMTVYLLISLTIALIMNWFNKRAIH